jgi:hypothetical protein
LLKFIDTAHVVASTLKQTDGADIVFTDCLFYFIIKVAIDFRPAALMSVLRIAGNLSSLLSVLNTLSTH